MRGDVKDRVEHLADFYMPFASAMPRRRDEGLYQTPFIVSQVAGITHAFARSAPTMLGCLHDSLS
jgi:hypothetical protein